ncbi:RNA polymerase ECF-type sigma factor [hydrothermal vent metagenome]|uniref:RNA polymerase ECF-type sigma factor n=1 Tax=hydrothermal vent metagenome TaxID=652676 RepID=A0A3B1AQP0_9ZZZZ
MDGKEFLHKMHAGDATVWDRLMPMLRGIALGACADLGVLDELKEDIVQDVAMRVFTRWQSYAAKSALSTWIYSIARNRCLDELRKRVVRGDNRKSVDDSNDHSTENQALNGHHDPKFELILCVQQVLAELDKQGSARKNSHRMIDVLIYWVEHTPTSEELANFLSTTVQAAKQRKYEIRKRMEELCRRFCGNDDCSLQLTGELV